ncbi:MAG: hypothetical protein GKR89_15125 [Candidatus Latescibacteria bacterium]|nr:hypothetical protein [Candidatus Latescibacterota bacterium]
MFCPQCGAAYYEGFSRCDECRAPLQAEPPPHAQRITFVPVLRSGNAVELAIAKSLLEQAEIPYYAQGEALQNLFGLGCMGSGFNPLVGPVTLQVDTVHLQQARDLLIRFIEPPRPVLKVHSQKRRPGDSTGP